MARLKQGKDALAFCGSVSERFLGSVCGDVVEGQMALVDAQWTPTTMHQMVLAWLRAERDGNLAEAL